jgi:hypothetical protein
MDPDVALDILREWADNPSVLTPEQQSAFKEQFKALDGWLTNGGFPPAAWTNPPVEPEQVDLPFLAVGNSEPLPADLAPALAAMLRKGRTAAGWCDHGNRFNQCPEGCTP